VEAQRAEIQRAQHPAAEYVKARKSRPENTEEEAE
jgi:hypothetical protein